MSCGPTGNSDVMQPERPPTTPTPGPDDATPAPDAPSDRDLAPDAETSQDAVEDVDAEREPGHGKS